MTQGDQSISICASGVSMTHGNGEFATTRRLLKLSSYQTSWFAWLYDMLHERTYFGPSILGGMTGEGSMHRAGVSLVTITASGISQAGPGISSTNRCTVRRSPTTLPSLFVSLPPSLPCDYA